MITIAAIAAVLTALVTVLAVYMSQKAQDRRQQEIVSIQDNTNQTNLLNTQKYLNTILEQFFKDKEIKDVQKKLAHLLNNTSNFYNFASSILSTEAALTPSKISFSIKYLLDPTCEALLNLENIKIIPMANVYSNSKYDSIRRVFVLEYSKEEFKRKAVIYCSGVAESQKDFNIYYESDFVKSKMTTHLLNSSGDQSDFTLVGEGYYIMFEAGFPTKMIQDIFASNIVKSKPYQKQMPDEGTFFTIGITKDGGFSKFPKDAGSYSKRLYNQIDKVFDKLIIDYPALGKRHHIEATDLVDRMINGLAAGANVGLYGPKGTAKTSLMKYLGEKLSHRQKTRVFEIPVNFMSKLLSPEFTAYEEELFLSEAGALNILLIDQAEAIFKDSTMVSSFLSFLNRSEDVENTVCIICTFNGKPEDFERSELFRPGRMHTVEVPLLEEAFAKKVVSFFDLDAKKVDQCLSTQPVGKISFAEMISLKKASPETPNLFNVLVDPKTEPTKKINTKNRRRRRN